jgi:hypothetical protein
MRASSHSNCSTNEMNVRVAPGQRSFSQKSAAKASESRLRLTLRKNPRPGRPSAPTLSLPLCRCAYHVVLSIAAAAAGHPDAQPDLLRLLIEVVVVVVERPEAIEVGLALEPARALKRHQVVDLDVRALGVDRWFGPFALNVFACSP